MKNNRLAKYLILICLVIPAFNLLAQEEVWLAKGEKALMQGKFEEAATDFTKVIDKNPSNKTAWHNRGLAYLYLTEFPASVADFTKAIELDPKDADAYNNRGLANIYMGNIDEAVKDLDKSVELDPKFAEAYLNRGTAYIELMNYPQAQKDLDQAIKLFDKDPNPNAYYERGRVFYKIKKFDESIKDFSEAIKRGIRNSKIYLSRGNAYFKKKDFNNAIADYTKSIELDPSDNEALNNRAVSYDGIGKKDLAEKDRAILASRKQSFMKNFPPFDSVKFKTFNNMSGELSINLPEEWNAQDYSTQYSTDYLVTREKISSDTGYYMVGVRMSLNKSMFEQYHVEGADSLLEFWKGSNAKNGQEYHVYDVISQKMMTRNGYSGILNQVRVQFTKKSFPVMMYELAYAKDNTLFYAYFQAPEVQFEYYKKIFDKALETFMLK